MGTQELKLPESYCYSNHRYFHWRLLSKASRFSESEHPFLVRSKISHILAGQGPPGCRSGGSRIDPGTLPFELRHSLNQVNDEGKV